MRIRAPPQSNAILNEYNMVQLNYRDWFSLDTGIRVRIVLSNWLIISRIWHISIQLFSFWISWKVLPVYLVAQCIVMKEIAKCVRVFKSTTEFTNFARQLIQQEARFNTWIREKVCTDLNISLVIANPKVKADLIWKIFNVHF